ncbi:hypothetical protein C8R42DRAFT_726482 [Lentinula raphanica]|nr:hypothetical protein C8R42DRAFT_726482 [Lentinula raphanica]
MRPPHVRQQVTYASAANRIASPSELRQTHRTKHCADDNNDRGVQRAHDNPDPLPLQRQGIPFPSSVKVCVTSGSFNPDPLPLQRQGVRNIGFLISSSSSHSESSSSLVGSDTLKQSWGLERPIYEDEKPLRRREMVAESKPDIRRREASSSSGFETLKRSWDLRRPYTTTRSLFVVVVRWLKGLLYDDEREELLLYDNEKPLRRRRRRRKTVAER